VFDSTCLLAPVSSYCGRCDEFLGIQGLHPIECVRDHRRLVITVETASDLEGCRVCGLVAHGHGRQQRILHDIPAFGTPVRLIWRRRRWICPEERCPGGTIAEDVPELVEGGAKLTVRAVWWAIGQMRREHGTVEGIARQLGVDWHTLWAHVQPKLTDMANDPTRLEGVTALGVDEHLWHHTPHEIREKGPKELTGMVDLTRDEKGKVHPRLLDLVPGRSGPVLKNWLDAQGTAFISGIALAAIDPFAGYKSALDATLDDDAVLVLDAFHVVALGTKALDEVRRRVQQATTGHRGRKGDPLHGIAKVLRTGVENLKDSHWRRIRKAIDADPAHEEVFIAWQAVHELRAAYQADDPAEGKKIATKILEIFSTCPIPEIARLGRTLRRWKDAFLAYFTTNRANNGPTEALNGIIELHRRLARGFRNRENYRLRMLLACGGLTHNKLR